MISLLYYKWLEGVNREQLQIPILHGNYFICRETAERCYLEPEVHSTCSDNNSENMD